MRCSACTDPRRGKHRAEYGKRKPVVVECVADFRASVGYGLEMFSADAFEFDRPEAQFGHFTDIVDHPVGCRRIAVAGDGVEKGAGDVFRNHVIGPFGRDGLR